MEKEKLISMVTGVQNGSEAAMEEMFNAFQPDLYYYILKTVNDPTLAEDLTQDAFMEILQSIATLQEPAAFVTWARQIAYRRCTAYFKKRHDLLADEDEEGYSVFDTVAEDRAEFIPDEALDREDLKNTIQAMIDQLPPEQRNAIMLRYFEEVSVEEIAQTQGVSDGTVKSRLNYGRKSIRQAVEDYEKRSGVKLHCVGVVPLLLWLLREYRIANGLSLTTGTVTTTATTAAAATAATTAATTTTATATAAKAGGGLAAKIIAGALAVSVGVGGVILATGKKDCDHRWETGQKKSVCARCDDECYHRNLDREEAPLQAGVITVAEECDKCGWGDERLELTYSDEPVFVTWQVPWMWEHLTQESLDTLTDIVKEQQLWTSDEVVCTPAGVMYYYNEPRIDPDWQANRIALIVHVDNGIVPGGWYTYISPNESVAIRSLKDEDGQYTGYSVTYANGHPPAEYLDSPIAVFHTLEIVTIFSDASDPRFFVYDGQMHAGHRSLEDCIAMAEKDLAGSAYQHLSVSPELEKYISAY